MKSERKWVDLRVFEQGKCNKSCGQWECQGRDVNVTFPLSQLHETLVMPKERERESQSYGKGDESEENEKKVGYWIWREIRANVSIRWDSPSPRGVYTFVVLEETCI